jgi:hypothetical protein
MSPLKTASMGIKKVPIGSLGVLVYLKKIVLLVWFSIILFSIYSAFSYGGFSNVANYLGGEIVTPTFQIYNETNTIMNQGGVYINQGSFFSNLGSMFKLYGGLFFAIISLFIWLRFYKIIATWVFTGDSSRVTSNWMIAITLFFFIQIIFIGYFHSEMGLEGMMIPFKAFWNLFRCIPYLIPGANL